jgi:hypothetical protein
MVREWSLHAESSRCTHAGAVFRHEPVVGEWFRSYSPGGQRPLLTRLADHDRHRIAAVACAR